MQTPMFLGALEILIGLFVLGVASIVVILLLAFERTRGVTMSLLGIGVLAVFMLGFTVLGYRSVQLSPAHQQITIHGSPSVVSHSASSLAEGHAEAIEWHTETPGQNFQHSVEMHRPYAVRSGVSWIAVAGLLFGGAVAIYYAKGARLITAGGIAMGLLALVWYSSARVQRVVRTTTETPIVVDAVSSTSVDDAWDFATAPRIAIDSEGEPAAAESTTSETTTAETDGDTESSSTSSSLTSSALTSSSSTEAVASNEVAASTEGAASADATASTEDATESEEPAVEATSESLAPEPPTPPQSPEALAAETPAPEAAPAEGVAADTALAQTQPAEFSEAKSSGAEKPAWIDDPPQHVGNVYRRVLSVGPYATHDECHAAMRDEVMQATVNYLSDQMPTGAPASFDELQISPAYILGECVANQYYEPRDMTGGYRMWTQYLQLEFDPSSTSYLVRRAEDAVRSERVTGVAMVGGGVLGSVALLLGLIRIDTATKGYYTKRLFIGVPAAIIGVLGLLAMVD